MPMIYPSPKKQKRVYKPPKTFPTPVKVPRRRPGQLYMLGKNETGQLGLPVEFLETLTAIPAFEHKQIKMVACGAHHTLVLDTEGIVWSFGSNAERALGRPTESKEEEMTPTPVKIHLKCKQVSTGASHSAALTVEGEVYSWGCYVNRDGKRYGVDSFLPEEDDAEYCAEPWPITIQLKEEAEVEDLRIIKVVSGDNHIVMLGDDSRMYTCGAWDSGQLGRVQSDLKGRRTRALDDKDKGYWLPDRGSNILFI